jgi:ornithine cyclodeaminase/alanine dehydrogenase-like protein (mu-crystallin family)
VLAIKTVCPSLERCRVAAKSPVEERQFVDQLKPILADMEFVESGAEPATAIEAADIVVTATSAQAPLLKADWVKPGSLYSHVGGFEDEYAVARQSDKIVCDDWDSVKHRTQTLSRMYKDGELSDEDVYANLVDVVAGAKPGRESDEERVYFNAVGLAYVDVAIALAMCRRAMEAGKGRELAMQDTMIFEHARIADYARVRGERRTAPATRLRSG